MVAGSTIGPYRVLEKLGAGGMGEVYLAEDTRLRRKVALKVLPAAFARDQAASSRLIREAQAAATLDHTNICTVYEVGEADGQTFIAMQYVEGQTLADRLARAPLELSSALAIAAQVGAALSEAHRRGILHRDVKPQNIMLTPDNRVKVLDFGLARTVAAVGHDANTAPFVTESGVITGTAPYMSPEQIRGEPLDLRSDVFSFGCVLYEMIGGGNPFLCGHAADTIAAILTRDPAPLPTATVPKEVQRIVRKALEKDRDRRYQTMRDLVIDLESAAREIASPAARPEADSAPRQPSRRRVALAAGAVLLIMLTMAAAITGYLYLRSESTATLSSADFVQITGLPDLATAPALSPDGRMVAFIRGGSFLDTGQIYVKQLPNGDPVQLTKDPRPKYGPAFTPDGSRITYTVIDHAASPLMSWDTWAVRVLGGEPARVLPNAAGLTWIDDRHVLFSEIEPGTGLHMGVVTAGEDRQAERRIYFPAHARAMAHYSYLSPDRRQVLVVEMDRTGTFEQCRVVPFEGSSVPRAVGPNGQCTAAAWSRDGNWMYFTAAVNGTSHIWRQRFPDGQPQQITFGPATEEQGIAIAPDGRSLVTSVGQSQGSLWIHDSAGDRLVPLDGSVSAPRMAADGARVYCLVQRIGDSSPLGLTQVDLASGKADRMLTEFSIVDFDIARNQQFVAFTAVDDHGSRHIWLASLDRRTPPRRIASDADHIRFGRDGELVYRSLTGTTNALVRVGSDGRGATRIFDRQVIDVGDVSPDGNWAILATPLPDDPSAGETLAVPVHGGSPRRLCIGRCAIKWSPAGSAIYVVALDDGGRPRLFQYRAAAGEVLPNLSDRSVSNPQGDARTVNHREQLTDWDVAAAGPDPSVYVFTTVEQRGNLFRVALR